MSLLIMSWFLWGGMTYYGWFERDWIDIFKSATELAVRIVKEWKKYKGWKMEIMRGSEKYKN